MKTRKLSLPILFATFGILLLLLAACGQAQPGNQASRTVQVVQQYYQLVNKGDIDNAAMLIADDAVFINPTGSYTTKADIVAGLRAQAQEGLTFELSNFRENNGRVVYDYIVKQKGATLDKGTNGLTKVKDGKIVFDGTENTEPR